MSTLHPCRLRLRLETTETHVVLVVFVVAAETEEEAAAVNDSFLQTFPLLRDHSLISEEKSGALGGFHV